MLCRYFEVMSGNVSIVSGLMKIAQCLSIVLLVKTDITFAFDIDSTVLNIPCSITNTNVIFMFKALLLKMEP